MSALHAASSTSSLNEASIAEFRRLFDQELQYVWNTLRYLGVRPSDVCDVAHEVFITVFQRFHEYDSSRNVRSWLFVIAYHAASNYRRLARHRREVLGDSTDATGEQLTVEEQVSHQQERSLLLRALEQIDLDKRVVLVMHDMDEIPIPEVAEALSIPLNTAYSRLRLARQELKEVVARLQGRCRE